MEQMISDKIYSRSCRICDIVFETPHKRGKICPKCQKKRLQEVKPKIINLYKAKLNKLKDIFG